MTVPPIRPSTKQFQAGRPGARPGLVRPLGSEDFRRWYGDWEPLDPTTIAAFMDGFDRPWWIVGGWSLETFTGVRRRHDDIDISIFASDAQAFRHFLGDRWTPWNVDDSWLRPFDDRFPDIRQNSQFWVRRDAQSPWVVDVVLTPETQGRWTNKRYLSHTEPLEEVTWIAADGLRYVKPEVALFFKNAQAREKDRRDAAATLPRLDERARRWLKDVLRRAHPEHEWLHIL